MGRDANREEEATWHTQAQRTLLPSFPTPLFLLGIWSALSPLVGCGRREKQVADVRGGVWWALVSSVYALYAPEWPCTRGPTKPNLPWSGLTFGHVTSALCRSCLSFPRTSGIQDSRKIRWSVPIDKCVPHEEEEQGSEAIPGVKRREAKPSSHLSQNPPERLHRPSSSSFLPSR